MFLLETLYYAILSFLAISYTLFLSLLLLNAKKTPSPQPDPKKIISSTVSILIPTYNEAEVIKRKLDNISEFDFPRDKLEVLVVDSASTDGTPDIVRQFREDHDREVKIELLERPVRLGKADAINEALRHVATEYFVLTDADSTNPTNALTQLLLNFQDKTVGAASGIEIPIEQHTFASGLESGYKAIYTAVRMAEAATDTPFMCESEFSAYRRDAIQPLRPGCMCDDIELTVGLRSTGLKANYDSRTLFFEREAGTLGSKLRHKLRRGMANQHALIRTSSVLLNKSFGKYGSIVFPFEFLTHIISPVVVTLGLGLLLSLLWLSPLDGILAVVHSLFAALPPIAILYLLTKRYGTDRIIGVRGRWDWAAGAVAFLFFQVALFASLVELGIRGPRLKWERVSETRGGTTVGVMVPETVGSSRCVALQHSSEAGSPIAGDPC